MLIIDGNPVLVDVILVRVVQVPLVQVVDVPVVSDRHVPALRTVLVIVVRMDGMLCFSHAAPFRGRS